MSSNTYHQAPDAVATAPPGCPMNTSWSPLDSDYLVDPYPIAGALRDEHPVFYAEQLGHVVVTKMEDIEEVFMNPDVFASTNVQDPIFPPRPRSCRHPRRPRLRPAGRDVEQARARPCTDPRVHTSGVREPSPEVA